MPEWLELLHRDMRDIDHRDDPFDQAATERSELASFRRNPFEPESKAWYAWRDGWLEHKQWREEHDAAQMKRQHS